MIKTILSLFVLILIFAIVYVYIIKPSTSPSTPANQTSEINGDTYQVTDELQDQTSSIFIIEELGIKFQIPVELQDLTYSIDSMFGTRVALLSSASLIKSDVACARGGLGWISLHRQGDALYKPTGYYYAFNDSCSRSLETMNLQRDLTESLRKSFKTSTTLSPLSEVADQTFEINGDTYQVTDELQDLTASIFTIEELGIKFQVTEELQDLTYSIEYYLGEPASARLSSASLVRSDISTGGSDCAKSGLGRISLHSHGEGLYKPTGFHFTPHDRCSAVPETMYLQRYLLESLRKSLSFSSVE